jgi:hypothetical protein
MCNLISFRLERVLASDQDSCMACAEHTIGLKIILESHLGPFGDNVSIGVRSVHGLRQMYRRLRNHFERTRWYSYVTGLKSMLVKVRLEIVLILTQEWCMVLR